MLDDEVQAVSKNTELTTLVRSTMWLYKNKVPGYSTMRVLPLYQMR